MRSPFRSTSDTSAGRVRLIESLTPFYVSRPAAICRNQRRSVFFPAGDREDPTIRAARQSLSKSLDTIVRPDMNKLIYWLLMLVPATLGVHYAFPAAHTLVFGLSAMAMIPLAHLLSESTENAAARVGQTLGALLNVTFGNVGEIVIGFFALRAGLQNVVKASITGSILVNLLLTLGISMTAGGMRNKTLTFNALGARTQATMLALAAISLIFPAAYHMFAGPTALRSEADLSLEFSLVLLLTYGLSLVFSLRTHRKLLTGGRNEQIDTHEVWPLQRSLSLLVVSAIFVGWMGEVLVDSVEVAAQSLGLTDLFVGLVIVAIAGNAAESTSAIRAALKGRMDLCVGVAIGSSLQIALFVGPLLVLLSYWFGKRPMDLVFTPAELVALVLAIAITVQIAGDGESNWFEGVQLLAVYLMLAVMIYYLPGETREAQAR
jgi:Ca2+:H+ antiporter